MRPRAIVLGAAKAGTTALWTYLARHPDVQGSRIKEIDFFSCPARYSLGLPFYNAHFPARTPQSADQCTFDVSPSYLDCATEAAPRIRDYDPKMRLIVLLRNPVDRAYSAWHMFRQRFHHEPDRFFHWLQRCRGDIDRKALVVRPPSFGEVFADDVRAEIEALRAGTPIEWPLLSTGFYVANLYRYFEVFGRRQVLWICREHMAADTVGTLRQVEAFVGLRPHSWTSELTNPVHAGGYQEPLPAAMRDLLTAIYRPANEALFTLLKTRLPWD